MALTEEERAQALAQVYREARHRVDSSGGNLHTVRNLLGAALYRALVAEELLMVIATQPDRVPDATVRAMATGLNGLLLTDPGLGTPPGHER